MCNFEFYCVKKTFISHVKLFKKNKYITKKTGYYRVPVKENKLCRKLFSSKEREGNLGKHVRFSQISCFIFCKLKQMQGNALRKHSLYGKDGVILPSHATWRHQSEMSQPSWRTNATQLSCVSVISVIRMPQSSIHKEKVRLLHTNHQRL